MDQLIGRLGYKLYSAVMDLRALTVPSIAVSFDSVSQMVKERGVSNCFGTALFLAGSAKHDRYVSGFELDMSLEGRESLKSPELGCLVMFYSKFFEDDAPPKMCDGSTTYLIKHAGIITGVNPAYVTHRTSVRGPVKQQPLEEIMKLGHFDARFIRI